MSKLEPTRTYSNPTATDVLRRLLDERGVEWRYKDERTTYWYGTLDGEEWGEWTATEMGGHLHLTFSANGDVVTPAQAIAATLGSYICTNGERTETCEADETDLVPFVRADSDECKVDYIHVMECTECGHVYEHVNGDYEYCPRCGRKRRDVEE